MGGASDGPAPWSHETPTPAVTVEVTTSLWAPHTRNVQDGADPLSSLTRSPTASSTESHLLMGKREPPPARRLGTADRRPPAPREDAVLPGNGPKYPSLSGAAGRISENPRLLLVKGPCVGAPGLGFSLCPRQHWPGSYWGLAHAARAPLSLASPGRGHFIPQSIPDTPHGLGPL